MRVFLAMASFYCGSLLAQPYQRPAIVERQAIDYTDEARIAELEGNVGLAFTVGPDGTARGFSLTHRIGLGLDELVLSSVKNWAFRPGVSDSKLVTARQEMEIPFRLPSHQSRWHLVGVRFDLPERTERPVFLSTWYPPGLGLSSVSAVDHGQIVRMMDRLGSVIISFEIDARGLPTDFQIQRASSDVWGPQAIEMLRKWRFRPGTRNGEPVLTRCIVDLVWGDRKLPDAFQRSAEVEVIPTGAHPRFVPPKPVATVEVEYPKIAMDAGLEGSVLVEMFVREHGIPVNLRVRRSVIGLDEAALNALEQWRFQPASVEGRSVAAPVTVEVVFSLKGDEPSTEVHMIAAAGVRLLQ
jgi:TonB family protein